MSWEIRQVPWDCGVLSGPCGEDEINSVGSNELTLFFYLFPSEKIKEEDDQ